MSILHTLNRSPFSHSTLKSCARVCTQGDGLLLIEDGVYAVLANAPYAEELRRLHREGVKIFALTADLSARGLQDKAETFIEVTDYAGFVALSHTHDSVQSWY